MYYERSEGKIGKICHEKASGLYYKNILTVISGDRK
jgi:hypothetical protein